VAQTVVFGSTQTSVAIAEDLSKGLVDRFRSLPMARAAFLTGRVFSRCFALSIHFTNHGSSWGHDGFPFPERLWTSCRRADSGSVVGIALTWVAVFYRSFGQGR